MSTFREKLNDRFARCQHKVRENSFYDIYNQHVHLSRFCNPSLMAQIEDKLLEFAELIASEFPKDDRTPDVDIPEDEPVIVAQNSTSEQWHTESTDVAPITIRDESSDREPETESEEDGDEAENDTEIEDDNLTEEPETNSSPVSSDDTPATELPDKAT